MTVNERLLKYLEGGPLTAHQLSEIAELPKTTVKIALLTMFKRGKVLREKKDREGKGPKTEYVYSCVS